MNVAYDTSGAPRVDEKGNDDSIDQLKRMAGVIVAAPDVEASIASIAEEVRQSEMESRLRRMITEVLKPSLVKVTRLQTDHELMCQKFQEMINSHREVMSAQKEAKEHSEVIGVFRSKLGDFWTFTNQLEDKINVYQKSAVQRMEELEHAVELNKSSSLRLGRSLDRALQDMDHINANIKSMQVSLEKGIQKNKERMDSETRQMHIHIGEVRDLHNKLEIEVWGPEDCSDISPPCLRKLDMQMKKQTSSLSDALEDIVALRKLDGELMEANKRQSVADGQIKDLHTTTRDLGERVEFCAQEAKADFKQASNLMAAFSANLVREARCSFKDELKHAQEMQKEVDEFVSQTKTTLVESDDFMKSLSKQLEAMVREVRFDLDSYDKKRYRDKQALEEQMRDLQGRVVTAADSSDFMLRGLEHVSGVISMSLQSERMSVALDLQDFVEKKDTPYVGIRESPVETVRLRHMRAEKGIRQPGVDPEALHRILYQPQPIQYQGTAFERPQLLALREKLVHVAQEVLQQGPEMKRKAGSPDNMLANLNQSMVAPRIPSADQTRCSTPARPGSRGQPGARGSPLLEGRIESSAAGITRELRESPDLGTPSRGPQLEAKQLEAALIPYKVSETGGGDGGADGFQLPSLAAPAKQQRGGTGTDRSGMDSMPPPLTAR